MARSGSSPSAVAALAVAVRSASRALVAPASAKRTGGADPSERRRADERRRRRGRRPRRGDRGGAEPAGHQAPVPRQPQGRGRRHQVNLKTAPGVTLTPGDAARGRPRDLEDGLLRGRRRSRCDARPRRPGRRHLRRSRRSRRSARSTSPATTRSALDKINEVLDLKKEQILDLAKVKKNVEKINDLYVEKGFYLAEVTTRSSASTRPRSTSGSTSTRTPRSRCGGSTSSATRPSPTTSCARDRTQRGRACCRS